MFLNAIKQKNKRTKNILYLHNETWHDDLKTQIFYIQLIQLDSYTILNAAQEKKLSYVRSLNGKLYESIGLMGFIVLVEEKV